MDLEKGIGVLAVEINYLMGVCGVSGWNAKSNESIYGRSGMGICAFGMKCGVVECVKRNTQREIKVPTLIGKHTMRLKWFGCEMSLK